MKRTENRTYEEKYNELRRMLLRIKRRAKNVVHPKTLSVIHSCTSEMLDDLLGQFKDLFVELGIKKAFESSLEVLARCNSRIDVAIEAMNQSCYAQLFLRPLAQLPAIRPNAPAC
jgi:5-methylcytosine-specific restriction endonuclease McrBC regulatory subunit McrC